MRAWAFGIMLVLLPTSTVWATTDISTIPGPNVTIFPTSGPPGTKITVTVSNIPDISKETYPYPDLYIFLPFSGSFGVTPQSQCGGEDCFPIYTHDEAVNHDFAERTVNFTLFSTINPSPTYLDGFENTVCDVSVNGKIVERYSTLCNTKDQPTGTYEIKLGWAEENAPQINHIVKTVQFTVTPGLPSLAPQKVDNGNSVIQEFQNGQISEADFYNKLTALGWNAEQIREAMASIGRLPHQMGAPAPDQMQQIQQGVQKAAEQYGSPKENTTISQGQTITPVEQVQTADSLTPYKTEQSLAQTVTNQNPQDPSLTMITIIASLGAASAIAGSILVAKKSRKVTN